LILQSGGVKFEGAGSFFWIWSKFEEDGGVVRDSSRRDSLVKVTIFLQERFREEEAVKSLCNASISRSHISLGGGYFDWLDIDQFRILQRFGEVVG